MAGVSFRSNSQQYTGFGGTTLVIAKPTGTVTGDLMFVSVLAREGNVGNGATISPPAGWTNVFGGGTLTLDDGAPGQHRFFWYVGYRIAQGGEGANYTFTVSGGANPTLIDKMAVISTYQNPDAVTPIAVIGTPNITYDVNAGIPVASITPGITDSLIVDIAVCEQVGFEGATPSLTSDENITAGTANYKVSHLTPIFIPTSRGLRTYVTYTPGHVPWNKRSEFIAAFGDLSIDDYPWHPATATGTITYDGGFTPRWFTGAVSFVLKNSLVVQTASTDLIYSQSTASIGTTTIHADGSIDYDPIGQFVGTVDAFRYAVASPRISTTAPIRMTISTAAVFRHRHKTLPLPADPTGSGSFLSNLGDGRSGGSVGTVTLPGTAPLYIAWEAYMTSAYIATIQAYWGTGSSFIEGPGMRMNDLAFLNDDGMGIVQGHTGLTPWKWSTVHDEGDDPFTTHPAITAGAWTSFRMAWDGTNVSWTINGTAYNSYALGGWTPRSVDFGMTSIVFGLSGQYGYLRNIKVGTTLGGTEIAHPLKVSDFNSADTSFAEGSP